MKRRFSMRAAMGTGLAVARAMNDIRTVRPGTKDTKVEDVPEMSSDEKIRRFRETLQFIKGHLDFRTPPTSGQTAALHDTITALLEITAPKPVKP